MPVYISKYTALENNEAIKAELNELLSVSLAVLGSFTKKAQVIFLCEND